MKWIFLPGIVPIYGGCDPRRRAAREGDGRGPPMQAWPGHGLL